MVQLRAQDGFSGKKRILVADDERVIANTLAAILNLSGFEARAVYTGNDAVDAVVSFRPDVLISDVMMPGMTGIEAAIRVLAQCPFCKILLFSGQAATADLLREAQAQGHDFELLAKPVHPSDLLGRLRSAEYLTGRSVPAAHSTQQLA